MSFVLQYDVSAPKQMLVEFSNGVPKEGSQFRCRRYQDKRQDNPRFRQHRKLLVNGSLLKYLGNNFSHRDTFPHAQKYVIAKINRRTRVAKVYDTDCFHLSPLIVHDDVMMSSDDDKVQEQLGQDERTFTEKQDDLTEVFGSHKRKRAMVSRQRNKVTDSTAVVQSTVENLLKNGEIQLEENEGDELHSIVPCVRNASNVEDVYPLTALIPSEVSEALRTEAQKFVRPSGDTLAEWEDEEGHLSSDYILRHAKSPTLAILKNDDVYEEYACCLQLLVYLIRTYKLRSSDFRKPTVFEDVPEPIRAWLLSQFFLGGKGRDRRMPNRMKDKVLAYGIVLAWHIDSFATNAVALRDAFAVTSKKMSTHVRALGGTIKVSTREGVKFETATLSLPLQFLRVMRTRR